MKKLINSMKDFFKKQDNFFCFLVILFVLSIIIDLLIIRNAYLPCKEKMIGCSKYLSYILVTNNIFLNFFWIENVVLIISSIIYSVKMFFKKKYLYILFCIVNILSCAIIWLSILALFSINFGL